ncbi:MAG: DUF692 domain-containing protein [Bdellovibrionales bacterium]|nr:DUF692 domain-containing protein [Bdellovibrionales bacterium]
MDVAAINPKSFGLGFRSKHFQDIQQDPRGVEWFEVLIENFMGVPGLGQGYPLEQLKTLRSQFPLVFHGVSLGLGNTTEFNKDYLQIWTKLIAEFEPEWVSDHLCWNGVEHKNSHDLLPMPYTEEAAQHISDRLDYIQNLIKQPFVIENVSNYIEYENSEMNEWEFLNLICKKSGCKLLLDINNIYVNSFNHNFDAENYLLSIAENNVQQIHLAGHHHEEDFIVDTHDASVSDKVWELYRQSLKHHGPKPTMIEWDDNIPEYKVLVEELNKARKIQEQTHEFA